MLNPFKNWQLKILAVTAAMMLLLFVVGVENNVVTLPENINPVVKNLAGDLAIESDLPAIRVKVRSSKNSTREMIKDVVAELDLKQVASGKSEVKVNVYSNNEMTEVVDFEPKIASLEIKRIISKTVDLKLGGSRKVAEGYLLKNTTINPGKVTVSGEETEIANLKQLTVNYALTGNESSSFSRRITLKDFLSETDSKYNFTPLEAEISFEIQAIQVSQPVAVTEKLEQRIFKAKVNLPPSYISSTEQVDLTLVGREKDLAAIASLNLTVSVDQNGEINLGSLNLPTTVDAVISKVSPSKIEVTKPAASLNFLQLAQ